MSQRHNAMPSQTLKELERDRLVLRKECLKVPMRVEYELPEQAIHPKT